METFDNFFQNELNIVLKRTLNINATNEQLEKLDKLIYNLYQPESIACPPLRLLKHKLDKLESMIKLHPELSQQAEFLIYNYKESIKLLENNSFK